MSEQEGEAEWPMAEELGYESSTLEVNIGDEEGTLRGEEGEYITADDGIFIFDLHLMR